VVGSRDRGPLRLVEPEERGDAPSGALPGPFDLDAVFRTYARYVGAVAYRLLGRDEEVDDVVQEVFVEALSGIGSLVDRGALKGWLRTITVRVVSRRLRARRMRRFLGIDRGADYETMPGKGADPETTALFGHVYRTLDGIPVAERLAWSLRHVEGLSLDEVAQQCGVSLATAKRRIAAAHQRLTKELDHRG
jgi:RNA polymerase sigma-70 factor (ECF subfamily)